MQRLTGGSFASPHEAVSQLVAVQSQDYAGAKWALGQRVAGCTEADVEAAYAAGTILRTHVLRPTWHFVAAEDLRWLLRLTGPRIQRLNAHRYRELDLDSGTLTRCHDAFADALGGGGALTRAELGDALAQRGIDARSSRLAHAVMHAELEGLVCSGPPSGKQHTYMLLAEIAPTSDGPSGDAALAELALRFFASHGPASVHDLAWWSGLRVSDARTGLELVRDRLDSLELDGREHWYSDPPSANRGSRANVLLLPDYDESFVGYRNLRGQVRGREPEATLPERPVVIGGETVGTWRRTLERGHVRLEARLFGALTKAERTGLDRTVGRYGSFLGRPVELELD